MVKVGKKIKKSKNGSTKPRGEYKKDKKSKKPEPAQVVAGDVKFGSYIAKVHKALQNDPDHDHKRTITGDSVGSIENMTDHFINTIVDNGKHVMRYTKSTTYNLESARATVNLALAGELKKAAAAAGDAAVEKYLATLPPPKSAAAAAPDASEAVAAA